jgi:endonuclease YncB( thermonuclease family)
LKGEFISVSDGDTITVLHDGSKEKIRIMALIVQKKTSQEGREAKQLTKSIVSGRTIEIDSREKTNMVLQLAW